MSGISIHGFKQAYIGGAISASEIAVGYGKSVVVAKPGK